MKLALIACLISRKWIFLLLHIRWRFLYLLTFLIFYIEVLSYYLATYYWNYDLECGRQNCTRVLLVADPQLIGLQDENYFVTPFAVWDSDRYLARTFSYAFRLARPDVILFLGDLFDEGSKSSNQEFASYVDRLRWIFEKKWAAGAQHVYIPGDNDIGGEGNDLITKFKVDRFNHYFRQRSLTPIKNHFTIHNINRFFHATARRKDKNEHPVVGVSHLPLVTVPGVFVQEVLQQLRPHVLFTAHEHKAIISEVHYGAKIDPPKITWVYDNAVYTRPLRKDLVHEFQVPTCSYRMGTVDVGYGFAVIDENEIRYTVLWTPCRLTQLVFYAILGLLCLLWIIFKRFCSKRRQTAGTIY